MQSPTSSVVAQGLWGARRAELDADLEVARRERRSLKCRYVQAKRNHPQRTVEDHVNHRHRGITFSLFVLLMVAVPLFAHHGNAAYENKKIMLKGTVTAWIWTNPHVFLKMDVKDDQGNITHWTGELVAPSNIINFGFRPDTFKPGDEVTMVTTNVARNGAPVARLSSIILADGKVMKTNAEDDGNAAAFRDHEANAQK